MTNPSQDSHHSYAQGRPIPGGPPKSGFLSRLSPPRKAAFFITSGVLTFLLICCGGSALIGALSDDKKSEDQATGTDRDAVAVQQAPARSATSSPAQPKVEIRTVTETQPIAFTEKTVNDSSMEKGSRAVITPGKAGVKTLTYEVTFTDGVESGRKLVGEVVTTAPVGQVTTVGTKAEQEEQCDENYTGACVPIASDVDCEGGSGNGPAYVRGPVTVVGIDKYKLDTDKDGVACES